MSILEHERTSAEVIMYMPYTCIFCVSFRDTSKAIQPLFEEKGRSHVAIWKWVQRFNPKHVYCCKRVSAAFLIDETMVVQIGSDEAWLWIAIEPTDKLILGIKISFGRSILVAADRFLQELVRRYGKHPVSTDDGTWYPYASKFATIKHHLHSFHDRSIIERTVQYFKDRTECFDNYFSCRKINCNRLHVHNWLKMYIFYLHMNMDRMRFMKFLLIEGG
jgi:putative transposase